MEIQKIIQLEKKSHYIQLQIFSCIDYKIIRRFEFLSHSCTRSCDGKKVFRYLGCVTFESSFLSEFVYLGVCFKKRLAENFLRNIHTKGTCKMSDSRALFICPLWGFSTRFCTISLLYKARLKIPIRTNHDIQHILP